MGDWHLPWKGGCRCGRVRLEVSAAPLLGSACHCFGCQSMSSSAFSLTVTVPSAGFAVTQGEPVIGGLHGATRHYFCPHCMTWMFTRPEGMDEIVNLRPTMLDDHSWFTPMLEVSTAEKLPWATTSAEFSFEHQPAVEEYQTFIAAWTDRGPRPIS